MWCLAGPLVEADAACRKIAFWHDVLPVDAALLLKKAVKASSSPHGDKSSVWQPVKAALATAEESTVACLAAALGIAAAGHPCRDAASAGWNTLVHVGCAHGA